MSWKTVKLEDICVSISDGDHQAPPKVNKGIPFITISNIDNLNKIDFSNVMYVPDNYYDGLDTKRKPQKNDILYSVVGTFGKPVYIDNDDKFVFQRHIAILRPNLEKIVPKFLYHIMLSREFYAQADTLAIGAAQRTISLTALRKMKVDIPSLEMQNKITSILAKYDDLIANNNKRIKILEQMAENLYKEWFVRFRFPGYETAEFVDGVPKGWEYQKLKSLLEIFYGKDHKKIADGDIPIFGSGGIMRYGNKSLHDGEVILIPRKGTLNNIMYYSGKVWTVDTMFYAVSQIPNTAKYIYYTLNNFDMESYNSGAALPSMTTAILYNLKILLPDEKTLEKYDSFVGKLFEEKECLEKQNQNLIKQRDYLLPRLMSGKVQVK